jgi:hypothetical protein
MDTQIRIPIGAKLYPTQHRLNRVPFELARRCHHWLLLRCLVALHVDTEFAAGWACENIQVPHIMIL